MKRAVRRIAVAGAIGALAVLGAAGSGPMTAQAKVTNYKGLTPMQKRLTSGAFATALGSRSASGLKSPAFVAAGGDDENSGVEDPTTVPAFLSPAGSPSNYQPAPSGAQACATKFGSNVKVNQNCENLTDGDLQGRAQAQNETSIAYDPHNREHLVASYNDYRRGDGNCYGAYSLDGGRSWNDTTIPMGFTRGGAFGGGKAREYWQAGGDTSVAYDTKGNAYLSCQVFNRGSAVSPNPDQSSAFYVFRSTGNAGASWNFPGRPVAEMDDTAGSGAALLDKQLLTVDNHEGSPFQDRVYVSWTTFAADGTAIIYEAYSADYGETFSAPVVVSSKTVLCNPNSFGVPTDVTNCNENQFSQPFTGADGMLYVAWANYNNQNPDPTGDHLDNRYQMLLARSSDGGKTFSEPTKVADFYDLPDCATYQGKDAGRACVPEKGDTTNSFFRATNYPSGVVDPKDPTHVAVTFGSYINRNSNEHNGCVPAGFSPFGNPMYTGVKTAGACNNDILVSDSRNGGASFSGAATDPREQVSLTDAAAQRTTDQWWQWADYSVDGVLTASYYDRQYGDDELTGYSDVSVTAAGHSMRATTASMPPPTQFGGVFYGDYTGLTVTGHTAHPLWSDTRNAELFLCPGTGVPGTPPDVCTGSAANAPRANDQDAFTTRVNLPTG
ncbi:MAG: sialidase family protein [Actinomycetota bacterium]